MSVAAAGKYHRRATLQSTTETEDASYGLTEAVTTVCRPWVSIESQDGRITQWGRQIDPRTTHVMRTPYRSGNVFRAKRRLVLGTRTFEILSAIDVEDRHEEHQLLCREATQV